MSDTGSAAPDAELLRLVALDVEDLPVLSAHCQDAVLKAGDLLFLPAEQRFVVVMNRFVWEATGAGWRKRDYQRRRAALHFDRVETVRSTGIDRDSGTAVLALLAVSFEPRDSPSGDVVLNFAGGGAIRLGVECLEAQLADLGPAWATAHAPHHIL
jgi:Protein of unknown function (DUF2948)